jgi:hypothetical protein
VSARVVVWPGARWAMRRRPWLLRSQKQKPTSALLTLQSRSWSPCRRSWRLHRGREMDLLGNGLLAADGDGAGGRCVLPSIPVNGGYVLHQRMCRLVASPAPSTRACCAGPASRRRRSCTRSGQPGASWRWVCVLQQGRLNVLLCGHGTGSRITSFSHQVPLMHVLRALPLCQLTSAVLVI